MELKPCPFCGSTNVQVKPDTYRTVFVGCNDCLAAGPNAVTESEAVEAWNTRHPVTTQEAARKILAGGEWSEFMAAFSAIQDGVDELASPEQILKAAMQALAAPDKGAE